MVQKLGRILEIRAFDDSGQLISTHDTLASSSSRSLQIGRGPRVIARLKFCHALGVELGKIDCPARQWRVLLLPELSPLSQEKLQWCGGGKRSGRDTRQHRKMLPNRA
jgi:hypothetical protein